MTPSITPSARPNENIDVTPWLGMAETRSINTNWGVRIRLMISATPTGSTSRFFLPRTSRTVVGMGNTSSAASSALKNANAPFAPGSIPQT